MIDRTESMTQVKALDSTRTRVHVGYDAGSYDSYPICGALKNRNTETVDDYANCPDCRRLLLAENFDISNWFDVDPDFMDRREQRMERAYDRGHRV